MSNQLAKNAHNRVIARVAERTGLTIPECNFMINAMCKAVKYYLNRPWLIPGDNVSFAKVFRFSLNLDLIVRHAYWEQKDDAGNSTIFNLIDRVLLMTPTARYVRLRTARFLYYQQQVGQSQPKVRKALFAYLFITKEHAATIARELASKPIR